jgi:hypothetical protein
MPLASGSSARRFAAGGTANITVANSSIPALTSAQASAYPTMSAATPIAPVSTAPQPYSNAMAQVPLSALSGGMGSNGIIAPVSGQGVPSGQPGTPRVTTPSPLGSPGTSAPAPVPTPTPATTSILTPDIASATPGGISRGGIYINSQGQEVGSPTAIKRGGIAKKKFAAGGIPTSEALDPWYTRAEERGIMHPEGLIASTGAGRTDVHNMGVPSGAYIVPADVVSGLGEGNTLAGSSVIDRMMHSNPYGIQSGGRRGGGMGIPRPPAPYKEPADNFQLESRGGRAKDHGEPVQIVAAGGEHVIYPQTIIQKFGSLKHGHQVLDKWVIKTRKDTIDKMKKLKPPKV